jgi:hypothetical protein
MGKDPGHDALTTLPTAFARLGCSRSAPNARGTIPLDLDVDQLAVLIEHQKLTFGLVLLPVFSAPQTRIDTKWLTAQNFDIAKIPMKWMKQKIMRFSNYCRRHLY